MKAIRIAYEYAETRNYNYSSVHVALRVEAELGDGETATEQKKWLKDYVQQHVKSDADEALRSMIEWSIEDKNRAPTEGLLRSRRNGKSRS